MSDRFGVLWQIVPSPLGDMLQDMDTAEASRVTQATLADDEA